MALSAEKVGVIGAAGTVKAAGRRAAKIQAFYEKWYPDAMTLIVVGNIDARSVAEQINKRSVR